MQCLICTIFRTHSNKMSSFGLSITDLDKDRQINATGGSDELGIGSRSMMVCEGEHRSLLLPSFSFRFLGKLDLQRDQTLSNTRVLEISISQTTSCLHPSSK